MKMQLQRNNCFLLIKHDILFFSPKKAKAQNHQTSEWKEKYMQVQTSLHLKSQENSWHTELNVLYLTNTVFPVIVWAMVSVKKKNITKELSLGNEPLLMRSVDLHVLSYSYGILLWSIVTGKQPYESKWKSGPSNTDQGFWVHSPTKSILLAYK